MNTLWRLLVSEQTPEIIYPEMLEYAWVKDMDRVVANSKHVKQDYSGEPVTADKLPKCPINLFLSVMKEAVTYPEVVDAYGGLSGDHKKDRHLLLWFSEYLLYKYGNVPDPRMLLTFYMGEVARSVFTGPDDPKLTKELINRSFICEDDGKNYDQEPASAECER